MKYQNPILRGFYPDPSVCAANGSYYMVCSSFQYFPGVPLFESKDLVNWNQIGYVLTRKSQVMLHEINSSGGVFAPTIRFFNGRFYMVTTNDTTHQNFYVYTDNIYSEWSEPVYVDQGGIDPSFLFEDEHAYFMSNGYDDDGRGGIIQCEIDINTGKKLSKSTCIWNGNGGRYLESPHLYKINGYYYLCAAEGGTEYGHMVTYARSRSVWGPFENYPDNPVLTNRNKAPYIIQGIGHGDLICDKSGDWHILTLGFRQQDIWMPFHQLGREVFLTPVYFHDDNWFSAGNDGTTEEEYEICGDFVQEFKNHYTFHNTLPKVDWSYLRDPEINNYEFSSGKLILHGTDVTLDDVASPTFTCMHQKEFNGEMAVNVSIDCGEAGICAYMTENEHYEIAIRRSDDSDCYEIIERLNIGNIKHVQNLIKVKKNHALLKLRFDSLNYYFIVNAFDDDTKSCKETILGSAMSKYLTSEVAGGFTGTVLALYAVGNNVAEFTQLDLNYK